MTKTVHKYEFPMSSTGQLEDTLRIATPKNSKVVHVGTQDGFRPVIWVERPAGMHPEENRTYVIFGTGWATIPDSAVHIGTVVMPGNTLVWHVYDVTNVE